MPDLNIGSTTKYNQTVTVGTVTNSEHQSLKRNKHYILTYFSHFQNNNRKKRFSDSTKSAILGDGYYCLFRKKLVS